MIESLIITALGTAVAISPTMAVTANHALLNEQVIAQSDKQDIALISGVYDSFVQLECRELERGEELTVSGYPVSLHPEDMSNYIQRNLLEDTGKYKGRVWNRDTRMYKTTALGDSGSSGGAVTDSDGDLVGVYLGWNNINSFDYGRFMSACEIEELLVTY